jgi:hypothetical protein
MLLFVLGLAGCSDDGDAADAAVDSGPVDSAAVDATAPDGSPPGDADIDAGSDAGSDAAGTCPRTPGPDDYTRRVVIGHPFGSGSTKEPHFEVLSLSTAGKLSKTGVTFDLGAAGVEGEIAFTPDGKIGLVALDDGTVGVFSLDAQGQATVIHKSFQASAYVSRVVMAPDGQSAYLLSSQWRNSGGGIYRVRINCDGTLTDEGLVAASKLPYALVFLGNDALLAARDVLSSTAGDDVFWLGGQPWQVKAGADAFGDDDAIISWAALTADQKYLLVADNNGFSSTAGDRVAVVEVGAQTLKPLTVLAPIKDPSSIVTSPYDNAALVLGPIPNEITVLGYTPQGSPVFKIVGPLTTSSKPQLPVDAVMVRRGSLKGLVLVTENTAIRMVRFEASGQVTEVSLYDLGNGSGSIPGAIGLQP